MSRGMRLVGSDERQLSRRERRFLRDATELDSLVLSIERELSRGLLREDVDLTFKALRRLLALGVMAKNVCDDHHLDLTGDAS
jgi:hypothetical protein